MALPLVIGAQQSQHWHDIRIPSLAQELIFAPCTCLSTIESASFGAKRCVLLTAQVSTARPDTSEVATPEYVPGTGAALRWLKGFAGEVVEEEEWDFTGKNLSAVEHVKHLALLVGRASAAAAPNLRSLKLEETQLTVEGMAMLSGSLAGSKIQTLKCAAAEISCRDVIAPAIPTTALTV